jgi:pimeloyl-ACP methyl ester carboxylesterase
MDQSLPPLLVVGDDLYIQVEGPDDAQKSVVYVHGFGSHLNEGYAPDLVEALAPTTRVVRFDFSSCGQSTGKQEEICFHKMNDDLENVLKYVHQTYQGTVSIVAHSMGSFVTAQLSPEGIAKAIFTGVPNADTWHLASQLQNRILKRFGGIVNEQGVTQYPRKDGTIQQLGPDFWKDLKALDPVKAFTVFSKKTSLVLIRPLHDEVVGKQFMEPYKEIQDAKHIEIEGDHNFTKPQDREAMLKKIVELL